VERDEAALFSRLQVLRLLNIDERKLRNWERYQLIPLQTDYRFSDLLTLKTIARLRGEKVPLQRIRRSLAALRDRLKDTPDLFSEVRVFSQGSRVRVQIGKQQMEPISGQLLFDFQQSELNKLLHLPATSRNADKAADLLRKKMQADHWFERGLELEQQAAPIEQIIEAYQKAAVLDPHAAGAFVNLGTIYFNGHAWSDAEQQYKKALEIDPQYALAHFNLANLYDEQGDYPNAVLHYEAAVKLHPSYADAHYNLALLHQNAGETLNAVRHWRAYLKLDRASTWSEIARRELAKLEALTVLRGSRATSKSDLSKRSAPDT
jgi:tetratricopeptide (TPR) repeat protein